MKLIFLFGKTTIAVTFARSTIFTELFLLCCVELYKEKNSQMTLYFFSFYVHLDPR